MPGGPCARDRSPHTVSAMTTTSAPTRSPVRIAAGVLIGLLALALAAGTVMFTLVLPEQKLVGWAVVAVAGSLVALWSVPGVVRGSRTSWTVALCWLVAYAYWGLYKVLVEGETESIGFTVAQVVILALLLVPAGRPKA